MKITKIIHSILAVLILLFILPYVMYAQEINWYCARGKNHIQPSLGNDLKICENYDVYWCDKRYSDINTGDKVIYLTFDAGYENGNVEKIVDILNEENVKGAFFILTSIIY